MAWDIVIVFGQRQRLDARRVADLLHEVERNVGVIGLVDRPR